MRKALMVMMVALFATVSGMAAMAQTPRWDASASLYGGDGQMTGVAVAGWNTANRYRNGGFDFGGSVAVEQRQTGQMTQISVAGQQPVSVAYDPNATGGKETATTANLLVRRPFGVSSKSPRGMWYPYMGIGGGAARQTFGGVSFTVEQVDVFVEYKATNDGTRTAASGLALHF